jgi:amino acid transporter
VYGWLASLSVFGFLTPYALVALATVSHRRSQGRLGTGTIVLSVVAMLAMVAVAVSTLFPVPSAPYRYYPTLYVGFMAVALIWHGMWRGRFHSTSQPSKR